MPGITGVLKMSNRDVDINALLTKMCKQMKLKDWYSKDTFTDESIGLARVGLGILNPEPQPLFNEDKTLCIIMDGEIYDYQSSKNDLVNKGHKFVVGNDPEFILHLFEECGKDFVYQLNGSFVVAIFDLKKQELLIVNDRYGLRPLYFAENNGYLLFSSEIKPILKDKSVEWTVDDSAVMDFLLFRRILGTKTFLKGIKLLPAASIMSCNENLISTENYWDFNFQEDNNHPEEYYVEVLTKLIKQAIERCLKGDHKIAASLSGGFDSRMILTNIVKERSSFHTYTWGGRACKDARFVSIIAKKFGVHNHFFEYVPDDFLWPEEEINYLSEGLIDHDSFGIINKLEEVRSLLDIEISGIAGGEILRGECLRKRMEIATSEEELFQVAYKGMTIDFPENLFNEKWYSRNKETSISCFRSLYDKYTDKPILNKVDHFFNREVLPTYVRSNLVTKNSHFEIRTPFFDNDLIDFVQTIPVSFRKSSYIMTKVLLNLSPELARISFEAGGRPTYTNQLQIKKHKAKELFRKIMRQIPVFGKNFRDFRFVDYDRWFRRNRKIQEYVRGILLSQKAKSRPYFKTETVQRILEDQFSGRKDSWKLISRLIILELWHKIFLENVEE